MQCLNIQAIWIPYIYKVWGWITAVTLKTKLEACLEYIKYRQVNLTGEKHKYTQLITFKITLYTLNKQRNQTIKVLFIFTLI